MSHTATFCTYCNTVAVQYVTEICFIPPYFYLVSVQSSDVPVLPFKQVCVVIRMWSFYVSENLNCDAV